MPQFLIELKKTGQPQYYLFTVDAADQAAAVVQANALAVLGGADFDTPVVGPKPSASASIVPTTMQADFDVQDYTQMLFSDEIDVGPHSINIGTDAALIGV